MQRLWRMRQKHLKAILLRPLEIFHWRKPMNSSKKLERRLTKMKQSLHQMYRDCELGLRHPFTVGRCSIISWVSQSWGTAISVECAHWIEPPSEWDLLLKCQFCSYWTKKVFKARDFYTIFSREKEVDLYHLRNRVVTDMKYSCPSPNDVLVKSGSLSHSTCMYMTYWMTIQWQLQWTKMGRPPVLNAMNRMFLLLFVKFCFTVWHSA